MKQIGSIQILRAVAALMVVLTHAQDDALNEAVKAGLGFAQTHLLPWVAGVDLFFVISGFIMVYASERLFATPGGPRAFLTRRVIRIVPLYWLVTAIMLVVMALLAWHGQATLPSLAEIATSFGFVPYARPGDGAPRPIVSLGWTLEYEMFFYVVFALFVPLRRETAVAGVATSLVGLVIAGALLKPSATALAFWSDPLVLEFALGMGIALAHRRGVRLPWQAAFALAAGALAVLALDLDGMADIANFGVDPNGFGRLFACGVPMAALFAATVLVPRAPAEGRVPRTLALLGDASYALYLFHPIVIVATRKAYLMLGLAARLGFWPLLAADLVAAAAVSVAIHRLVERPMTAALQTRLLRRNAMPARAPIMPPLPSGR